MRLRSQQRENLAPPLCLSLDPTRSLVGFSSVDFGFLDDRLFSPLRLCF